MFGGGSSFVVECYECVLVWMEMLCWIDCVWYSRECAWCACDHSVHLSISSIGFVYVFLCRNVISSFKSLRAGSQVLSLCCLFV